MVRSISVTDKRVIAALKETDNASKLIEVAVLYYLGEVDKSYVGTFKAIEKGKRALKEVGHD